MLKDSARKIQTFIRMTRCRKVYRTSRGAVERLQRYGRALASKLKLSQHLTALHDSLRQGTLQDKSLEFLQSMRSVRNRYRFLESVVHASCQAPQPSVILAKLSPSVSEVIDVDSRGFSSLHHLARANDVKGLSFVTTIVGRHDHQKYLADMK